MPTVRTIRGYRFFFYSREPNEPAHVHVEKAENTAKFWLTPVSLAWNEGFRSGDLREIRAILEHHAATFLRRWHEHFEQ